MDQLVLFAMAGIIVLLAINCWSLRQGLRAVDDQLNVLRETLQLEFAIRDLMEETERRQKQRDADR